MGMGIMSLRILAAAAIAVAFLSGCQTTKPLTNDEIKTSLASGNGLLLLGYDMPQDQGRAFWGVDIRRIDRETGKPERPNNEPTASNAATLLDEPSGERGADRRFATYMLQAGEYAITSIGPRQPNGGPVYVPNFGGAGGGGATAGLIGLAVLAAVTAAAYAAQEAEDSRFGEPGRPPLMFLYENQLVDEAPRFEIRPGEAVYLGDILYGSKYYTIERTEKGTGPNAADAPTVTKQIAISPFVEYMVDKPAAKAKLAALGLSDTPMRTVTVDVLKDGPVYVSPRMTRERLEYRITDPIIDEQVYSARTVLPRPLPQTGS
ncbi:hypothetical protein [Thalassobaculum sp.]|uniref:hypothetical protein n=1 Tax=Thalassobaculum sp. TaxID=2022740 RepID=UPI0032ECA810